MFRIKICGITTLEDARAAADAGADAIGLNFYKESPRYIDPAQGREIKLSLNRNVMRIGVYVNEASQKMLGSSHEFQLNAVQLHGDEPPSLIAELQGRPTVRARRMDENGVAAIARDLEACKSAGRLPDAVLVDALTPGRYGGTGETVSWAGLANYRKWLGNVPLILAGGLTPENVGEAIRTVRPYGIDVASGVESSPGVKDHEKVRRFVENAKAAFEAFGE